MTEHKNSRIIVAIIGVLVFIINAIMIFTRGKSFGTFDWIFLGMGILVLILCGVVLSQLGVVEEESDDDDDSDEEVADAPLEQLTPANK
jgi:membrane-bound ClpP family serine protease